MRSSVEFASKYFKEVDSIVEIGVQNGTHAVEMYEALHPKKIYLVDSFDEPKWRQEEHAEFRKQLNINLKKLSNCKFITDLSQIASIQIPNELDFIYIDACHNEESVIIDIACWYPKVKVGGMIAGHDFKPFNGVGLAVKRMFTEFQTALQVERKYVEVPIKCLKYSTSMDWWVVKERNGY